MICRGFFLKELQAGQRFGTFLDFIENE